MKMKIGLKMLLCAKLTYEEPSQPRLLTRCSLNGVSQPNVPEKTVPDGSGHAWARSQLLARSSQLRQLMLGGCTGWTDRSSPQRNQRTATQGELLAPLLHLPASVASRATAYPCTHILEPNIYEANRVSAPELGPTLAADQRYCFVC